MSYGLIGIYAIYFIYVGVNGNANEMTKAIEADAKGFAPMVLAILLLKALSTSDTLKPMINPFIGLALLTFTLKNYDKIASQLNAVTGLSLPESK